MDLWPGRSPLDLASGPWTKLNRTRNRNRPHWTLPTKCSASRVVSCCSSLWDLRSAIWSLGSGVMRLTQSSKEPETRVGSDTYIAGFYIHLHFSISPSLSISLLWRFFAVVFFLVFRNAFFVLSIQHLRVWSPNGLMGFVAGQVWGGSGRCSLLSIAVLRRHEPQLMGKRTNWARTARFPTKRKRPTSMALLCAEKLQAPILEPFSNTL